jgi:hypothetical protein
VLFFFFAFIVPLVLFKIKVLSVISVLVGYIFCDTLISVITSSICYFCSLSL